MLEGTVVSMNGWCQGFCFKQLFFKTPGTNKYAIMS